MEQFLDDMLKLMDECQDQEVTKEEQKNTGTGLDEETLDPDDAAFKLLYYFELQKTYNSEEDSGLNEITSDPPHCLSPQPSSSKSSSSGYYSRSSEERLSPPNQCRVGGKLKEPHIQRKPSDVAKLPTTLGSSSEDPEDESKNDPEDDENGDCMLESTEKGILDSNVNVPTNQCRSQCSTNRYFEESEEYQDLEYLKLNYALRQLDTKIDNKFYL